MRHGQELLLAAGLAAALLAAAPASGQRFGVELGAGGAIGNYTETDAGLDIVPGPAFSATVDVRLTGLWSAYAGINRTGFGCTEALCAGREVSLVSQGARAGVRVTRDVLWARGGLVVQSLRITTDAVTETSDPGLGVELGAGAAIPVGRGFRIRPGLTYMRHAAPTADADGHTALLVLEVGVAMRF